MKLKPRQPKKNYPRIHIERIGFDEKDHIIFIDLHDEKFGEAGRNENVEIEGATDPRVQLRRHLGGLLGHSTLP